MKARILDQREDEGSCCFLCSINLEEYVQSLPDEYQEYDVQRGIVSNPYLDHLVDTVLAKRHIPPIVLVVEADQYGEEEGELDIRSFKVLDGLQRTFRLKSIRKTIDYCSSLSVDVGEALSWSKFKFSRRFSSDLKDINSDTNVLRALLIANEGSGSEALIESYANNSQWFEVWTGLTPDQEVKKMLLLNAGHKAVKTRHQLELLFLNLLPKLQQGQSSNFRIVREREVSATQHSKSRECGDFHFAHIIASLVSLFESKPVTPSVDLIQSLQNDDSLIETYSEIDDFDFLKGFVSFLVRLDKLLSTQYPSVGVLWMGREVSLAGLFAALGVVSNDNNEDRLETMDKFYELLEKKPFLLNLEEFERVRNNLDLSKVNIGSVNRKAVLSAILDAFKDGSIERISWKKYFGMEGA